MILNFLVNGEGVEDLIDQVFQPEEGIDQVVISDETSLEGLAIEAGVFPSRGQSRKNGLHGPIPWGLTLVGTKKRRFWVWNPVKPEEPVVFKKGFDHTERWWKAQFKKAEPAPAMPPQGPFVKVIPVEIIPPESVKNA